MRKTAALLTFAIMLSARSCTGSEGQSHRQKSPPRRAGCNRRSGWSGPRPVRPCQGVQIYTCEQGAAGRFEWTLKGPEAELKDRKDKVIGQHTAGPTWKLKDGSEVTGKPAAQVDSLDSESVPWLLIDVVNNSGKRRAGRCHENTTCAYSRWQSGKWLCDEAHKGAETKSDYTADYYFFAPAK